jgi:hypothetical protein
MRQSGLQFRFLGCPVFFDRSTTCPLSEFFLKSRLNTHFEKTLLMHDACADRCFWMRRAASCLEFIFFLCPFVIADRKSQYRNTGQFASFSPCRRPAGTVRSV